MPYNTQELVADLKSSGLTQKEYCTRKAISTSTLAYHLRKHKEIGSTDRKAGPSGSSFVPVNLGRSDERYIRTVIVMHGEFSNEELIRIINSANPPC